MISLSEKNLTDSGDVFTRRNFLKIAGGSLLALTVPGLGSEGLGASSSDKLELGGIFSLSGPNAPVGRTIRDGARLAVERINREGGIGGEIELDLVVEDGKTSQTGASEAARRLANRGGIGFALGPLVGTHGRATQPILGGAEIPQMFFGTDVGFTDRHDEYPLSFRFGTQTALQFVPPLVYAVEERDQGKLFLLTPNNQQGGSIEEVVQNAVSRLEEGELVGSESYPPFNRDFSSLTSRVWNSEAEGVVIGTGVPADLVSVAREFDRQGLDPTEFGYYTGQTPNGAVAFENQIMDEGLGEGIIYSWHYDKREYGRVFERLDPPEEAEKMEAAFEERFGSPPDSAPSASWGWGGVRIIKQGIEGLMEERGKEEVLEMDLGTQLPSEVVEYLLPESKDEVGPEIETPFGNAGFLSCGQFDVGLGVGTVKDGERYLLKDRGYGREIIPPLC